MIVLALGVRAVEISLSLSARNIDLVLAFGWILFMSSPRPRGLILGWERQRLVVPPGLPGSEVAGSDARILAISLLQSRQPCLFLPVESSSSILDSMQSRQNTCPHLQPSHPVSVDHLANTTKVFQAN